jgi:hypothetical protein
MVRAMTCLICGQTITLTGNTTTNGRAIGSCGDAFRHFSAPRAGDGATISSGSDAYPATITEISKGGKIITLLHDDFKVVSGSVLDGSAEYEFRPGPSNGRQDVATWREKEQGYRLQGCKRGYGWVTIGRRVKYYDPHF